VSDNYREDLDRAISFAGAAHEFFARAKALELLAVARRHLGNPDSLDALDAGCGVGLVVEQLHGRFRSLTGTDVSSEALAVASRENPGVRFEPAEPGRLPFGDGEFDLCFTMNVVQVIPPPERASFLAELARVTRETGLVVVFEHNPYNPLTRLVVRRFASPDDIHMLPMRETRARLRSAGLGPIDAGYLLTFPTRRERVVAAERALRRLPLGAQYYMAARPLQQAAV